MNVRVVQIDISNSVTDNIQKALFWAQSTHSPNLRSDVVLFPEMFICGFDDPAHIKKNAIPHDLDNNFFSPFEKICQDLNCHLILGSLPMVEDGKIFNASLVLNPQGKSIYRYDKMNLFPLMNESHIFFPGNPSQNSFTLTAGKTQFSALVRICYDLRFPEIFRNPESGYYPEVIFLPMQWPAPRTETFRTLARARAIENQSYVVVCNRVGRDRHNTFEGNSMVIGPDGNILAEMGGEEGCLNVTLDQEFLKEYRTRYPFLQNKKIRPSEKELSFTK